MLSLLLEAMKSKELLSLLQSIILQQVNNMQLFKYLPLKGVSLFNFSYIVVVLILFYHHDA